MESVRRSVVLCVGEVCSAVCEVSGVEWCGVVGGVPLLMKRNKSNSTAVHSSTSMTPSPFYTPKPQPHARAQHQHHHITAHHTNLTQHQRMRCCHRR